MLSGAWQKYQTGNASAIKLHDVDRVYKKFEQQDALLKKMIHQIKDIWIDLENNNNALLLSHQFDAGESIATLYRLVSTIEQYAGSSGAVLRMPYHLVNDMAIQLNTLTNQ